MLSLQSTQLPISHWESVLPEALHSIRSLLCTTNPFALNRRLSHGTALPKWLTTSLKVFLRRFKRASTHDLPVDEVELTNVNQTYAHIRQVDGR